MTTPWRPPAVHLLAAALGVLVAGCRGTPAAPPPAPPGAITVPASAFPLGETAPANRADPAGPVTFLGRSVFPRCQRMVVGLVLSSGSFGKGADVVRIEEKEILWGAPVSDPAPYTVLCGAAGLAPKVGTRALFLLRVLPGGSCEAVEVSPTEDAEGPARLRAFREYLRIEDVEDPAERRAALLAYLRRALDSSDRWTRDNSIREYAAFAEAFPRRLEGADGAALARALPSLRDPALRKLAQQALDNVAAAPAKATARTGSPAPPKADLAPFTARFDAARGDPMARREAVLDAAAKADRAAAPLVARGLDDTDPRVREASAVAAAETGMTEFGARILSLAVTDASPTVRSSAVLALGHLRYTAAVETLAGLAKSDPAVAEDALFSLARIRDRAAVTKLGDLAADGDDARRKLIGFLLSEGFVTQEKALGARWTGDR